MIIGILSDTHIPKRADSLPKEIFEYFFDVDLIIHCGDLTSKKVLEDLKKISKIIAVSGNMDNTDFPTEYELLIDNFRIGIIHGNQIHPRGDSLKMKYLCLENNWDILISGHTHIPMIEEIDISENKKILLLNPGSPTVPRYPLKTVMKLKIENKKVDVTLIPIK
ncbi:phosphodiesterase, MJ0936 family [Methanococcus vannielii SB]|jgi:putative phosphoesterase|uniref:Phosphoesterase n=1 Tax=Methanococcus vannielii (strain ATCC 35089 / DSM 1224 / JCM 13029 / OCM 148 / SB) TaxID=406327 RepID=A6UQE4_METVS|nr:YfcE family phosphodiesterase [Methanococcus vannielii]ABR54716.1 phosphodiesterase, MJ0936 family [Methanococcus vannielii SB]